MHRAQNYNCALILFLVAGFNLTFAEWEPDRRLTENPGVSLTSRNSQRCIVSGAESTLHLCFWDDRTGVNQIYYLRSTDQGEIWEREIPLSTGLGGALLPSIASAGSLIHLAWFDQREGDNGEIYYRGSADNGQNWAEEIRMSFDTAKSELPCLAAERENVHLVWRDNRQNRFIWQIFYRRSTDGGVNWSAEQQLTYATSIKWNPSLAVSNGVVHLVWGDNRDGDWNVYYKRSLDNGVTWGPDIRLTENVFAQQWPCVAVDDSLVVVAWSDNEDVDGELWCRTSCNRGEVWNEQVRITGGSAQPGLWAPSLAISGSRIHAVWPDGRDGNFEIYYACSEDFGQNWTEFRLTSDSAVSNYPGITVDGTMVHVAWSDFRDSQNGEIYYKRNPTGNTGIRESDAVNLRIKGAGFTLRPGKETVIYDVSGRRLRANQRLEAGIYFVLTDLGRQKYVITRR